MAKRQVPQPFLDPTNPVGLNHAPDMTKGTSKAPAISLLSHVNIYSL